MWTWKTARRVVVAVVGGTILLIGVFLGPLPFVPAVVLIPLGLAILATEFVWAQRLLKKVKERTLRAAGRGENSPSSGEASATTNRTTAQAGEQAPRPPDQAM